MAKLTTAEILARARKQDGGAGGSAAKTAAASPPAEESTSRAAESPAESAAAPAPAASAAATPGPRPTSTSDILAKARAQAGGGGAQPAAGKPAAAKPAGAKAAAAKPATSATPKSTKDILAAARAQTAGGPAAATDTAETVAKPAPKVLAKPSPAAAAGGARPSVQEMLKKARAEKPAAPATTAAKPATPPLPQRPAPSKVRPEQKERRGFLKAAGALVATPFAAGWTAFTAASLAATLGMARFMMPNVLTEAPSKFKIGLPEDYPLGTVTTKWKAEYAIWITHQVVSGKPQIYALSTVCTHLGCTPNWLEGEQKFKCPCHGSGFYPDGINFEGPAPRPLERYGITLASDGMLEVDKSLKFQEELGQWNDPASFVATG